MMRGKIFGLLGPYLPSISIDPQKIVFYGHCISLVAAISYILPIEFVSPAYGAYKRMFYVLSMWSTILTSMFTIKANYGVPSMPQGLGFNMAAIRGAMASSVQPWLQKVMTNSKDFSWLFFALIFLTAYPNIAPLILLMRRSLWSVCSYAEKPANNMDGLVWGRLRPVWEAKLKPQTATINEYSARAEIVLGIFLVVSIALPTRQLLLTLLYWNYLTTRFKIPNSHEMHAKAWTWIGDKFGPVLKMAPFLNPLIEKAKGFFKQ